MSAPGAATGRAADLPVGKVMISLVALTAGAGTFAADWNDTHIYNPRWPPHAKFHNAQTMVSGAQLSAISLWQLWGRSGDRGSNLRWGTLFAALYWLLQAPAVLFPGAALTDPEFAGREPRIGPVPLNQITTQVLVLYPLLGVGYALERRRLGHQPTAHRPHRTPTPPHPDRHRALTDNPIGHPA